MPDRLTTTPFPEDPDGIVVMLHGGAERGDQPVGNYSLALRRTRRMFDSISGELVAGGAAVAMLRFSFKGWTARPGAEPSPVRDTRRAVAALHEEHPHLPIVLLGHSMGARAAAWAADSPGVGGVVGLAPWFPADDPVDALAGKQLVAAHGSRDRITSARASRRYVDRAAAVAEEARFVDMGALGHYMLTGADRWNQVAVAECRGILSRISDSR